MDAHDTGGPSVAEDRGSLAEWVDGRTAAGRTVERHLWAVVVLALVADVHLTYVGLQSGFPEGNPVARLAIDAGGIWGLALAKVAVLAVGALVRRRRPRHGPVVALGLAVPWVTAAALNAVTVVGG